MTTRTAPGRFTGWHMTAILVGFFVLVMAVNFVMARLAYSTFGGKVVENSYVASQNFNALLARADAQDRLGWRQSVRLDPRRHVRVTLTQDGRTLAIAGATATIHHPLGRIPSEPLALVADGQGGMISSKPLPQGRWRIDLVIDHAGEQARYRSDLK